MAGVGQRDCTKCRYRNQSMNKLPCRSCPTSSGLRRKNAMKTVKIGEKTCQTIP